ncbi:MAG: HTH-type transcriptional activator RhaS [Chroococcidiopsis cubana SAG 39.79]|uniref:AraC family transcriptional regulator n=1 Tax=Chroococcidiopsis cubana SAG 39.79 TaxID=388085 RepID=A0AB37UT22_9CYAN|nr:AraC family transcriptional regulator [Chroococcidiopsis cubana]MDZ4878257.1 HTH-type transcriptional activator RhaS [Chroococcidiopsis cubana SAG 39.79]PSB64452.1 AraC family transcriptional regulator CmrA [Chroococcidiopsis cubana CCALA 043]RUT14490.1 AraC family transcriptional regulator [Chroococcidiopsis cubana SAG 39.79]
MNATKTNEMSDANLMNDRQAKREADQAQANRDELTQRIAQAIHHDGKIEPLKGLHFNRVSSVAEPCHSVSMPAFCVIAQGSKEVLLGSDRYQYDPMRYLLATAELPVISQILEASKEKPYLSVRLDLDPALVGSVMVEAGYSSPQRGASVKAIDVSPLDANLLNAVVRLVRLLDSPAEAHVLAPLIKREIIYRLLMGKQGNRLRQIAVLGGYTHHIAKAVERLRKDFNQPLRIESLARELGMSVSGFHHHFKVVTAMSPLQFQKQLRLQEARRLMLGQNLDASSTAYRVGYDDASHFNREYKRLFGEPPMRDVERLREVAFGDR